MTIVYDSGRGAYVDAATGDYMTHRRVDPRENTRDYYEVYRASGELVVGARVERQLRNYQRNDEFGVQVDPERVVYFIRESWAGDRLSLKGASGMDESDERIRTLEPWLRAAHYYPGHDIVRPRFEFAVGYDGTKA